MLELPSGATVLLKELAGDGAEIRGHIAHGQLTMLARLHGTTKKPGAVLSKRKQTVPVQLSDLADATGGLVWAAGLCEKAVANGSALSAEDADAVDKIAAAFVYVFKDALQTGSAELPKRSSRRWRQATSFATPGAS